ncbi:hypothetical protein K435DRAFT_156607 [Dendrothele bispora CBS 962.96]|uniref:Methyltransferase type 11 domain-containing protein n=1 Tax=Dendrothele bispora (strain CBS 962.96) TaxID=1314807 RepID=A0A4S8LY02_DENBC|nr:hypothetical protein K435DRAFT_156607 [Dendrothele bispora CBS 962.96]
MDLDVEEPGLQKMAREETSGNMDADQTPRSRSSDRPSSSGLAETAKGGKDVKASRSLPAIRTSNGQVNENEADTDSPLRLVRGVIQGLNDVVDGTTDKSRLLGVDVEASSMDSRRNIEFVKGNFLTAPLPFPSSSFDLVRIANLTYAIPYDKWDSLPREISRVLTAGGRLEVVDDHVFFAHARNPNPGGEHGTHKRQRPVSGSGTVMSSETDGDNGSFYFRHSLTPSQYSAFSLSGLESGSTSDPPSHSSPTQATATAVSSTLASAARPSDPDSSDKSHNYQRYLEALYHHRNLNQAWKNHQMTGQSLESLFEHLMNMKYGIHLCPSEFLEGAISRGLGYATELGTWHFVLMKPSPLRVETEAEGDLDESESAGTLVSERKEKRGRNKKKDDGPSPAAAIASDFRSRTMAALIANLGLPEEDKQNGGGSSEDESDEDDNDSEEDILKTSPGLMLWPRKILPMSQDELEASVLKHATVLLACGRQLGRYAGTLEVMKYRFEREEFKERMRKEARRQVNHWMMTLIWIQKKRGSLSMT